MATYRSTARYEALRAIPENLETLASWGWTPPTPSEGVENMYVVRNSQQAMISAVLFEADFLNQFEEVENPTTTPEEPPVAGDPAPSNDEPPVVDSP